MSVFFSSTPNFIQQTKKIPLSVYCICKFLVGELFFQYSFAFGLEREDSVVPIIIDGKSHTCPQILNQTAHKINKYVADCCCTTRKLSAKKKVEKEVKKNKIESEF